MTALVRANTAYEGIWRAPVALPAANPTLIRRSFAAGEACQPEDGGQFVLDAHCGSVLIRAADTDRVSATVEILHTRGKPASPPKIDFEQRGGRVSMRSRGVGPLAWLSPPGRLRLRFEVTVPLDFHIEVSTRGGSVEVDDVGGNVSVQTAGGWLSFRDIGGQLQATTSGGGIEVDGCRGDVQAKTAGGPIEVLRAAGSVRARTTGGAIQAHFEQAPKGRLETSGGNLDVWFGSAEGAQVDARTGGGQIEVEHGECGEYGKQATGVKRSEGDTRRNHLRQSVNGGGAPLVLRTRGGSIRLHEA